MSHSVKALFRFCLEFGRDQRWRLAPLRPLSDLKVQQAVPWQQCHRWRLAPLRPVSELKVHFKP